MGGRGIGVVRRQWLMIIQSGFTTNAGPKYRKISDRGCFHEPIFHRPPAIAQQCNAGCAARHVTAAPADTDPGLAGTGARSIRRYRNDMADICKHHSLSFLTFFFQRGWQHRVLEPGLRSPATYTAWPHKSGPRRASADGAPPRKIPIACKQACCWMRALRLAQRK